MYTYFGLNVEIVPNSRRSVPGGTVIDIRINDPRSIITYATVNEANLVKMNLQNECPHCGKSSDIEEWKPFCSEKCMSNAGLE